MLVRGEYMRNLLKELKEYLNQVLGVEDLKLDKIKLSSVPFLLNDLYDFYKIEIMSVNLLLFTPKINENITPGIIKKHIDIIKQKIDNDIFFLCEKIASYSRRDFIKYKIPFVIPGNQMYLPMIGIDFRERFRQSKNIKDDLFPAAQALLLYVIYNNIKTPLTASCLSEKLGYTSMTMGRAISRIATLGLGEDYKEGKERFIRFVDDLNALWKKALPYMKSPIKKEIFLDRIVNNLDCFIAELSALSECTMIVAPKYEAYAVSKDDWLKVNDDLELCKNSDDAKYKLQIWAYPPALFAENNIVDKLSLYLSLMNIQDERIEQSLENMMENFKW
jgi:hypothetical protein